MRLNTIARSAGFSQKRTTHEGAPARDISAEQELRRSVMACMLWENSFYESGESIADRIAALVPKVGPEKVAEMAIEARSRMNLRHVPLFLVREMARHASHRPLVRSTLSTIIQRADELTEFLAIYWKDKRQPLAKSVQRGLADAFEKFNEYQLAKYNRNSAVKLRDVLFLSHAKPKDKTQKAIWTRLANKKLETPDTWEVAISACGKDAEKKKVEWNRLLSERKLGGLALIRNLRNFTECRISDSLIREALEDMKTDRILPFRFLAALKYAPQFASELESAMLKNLAEQDRFSGMTVVVVDLSQSMDDTLSEKSEMTRQDAAIGVAIAARELSDSCRVFAYGTLVEEVPAYRGLALREVLANANVGSGTQLGRSIREIHNVVDHYDRLIVITDEQSHDPVPGPRSAGYVINVAAYKNGIGYGPWKHIDGWSDRVLDYVRVFESEAVANA